MLLGLAGCLSLKGVIEMRGVAGSSRPKPARRVAPKQPDGEPSLSLFRFYEAAVGELTSTARNGHSEFMP